ncbi:MAG: hypothetical protein ACRDQ4_09940 [Pseudonocardiaceae bacterium]
MTVRRPADWAPLEPSDPLPGDPDRITDEARRLRDTATEMRTQISRLQAIGRDDTLKGQHAEQLRTAAADLAGQLQKTVGRYQRVAGELSRWAPELTHAQTESVRALEKAKAAEAARAANTVMPRPGDPPPSPDEQARERRRRAALDDATQDLAAARRQLNDALEHATSEGRRYAGRINDAIDDDVADSWWDSVKDWVHRNAGWIKTVTDILSWVATGLAVVALFIPGVNIIAILALGLTFTALAGHTALALSGDGSWADVALDVFALATLGVGKFVARGLKGVQAVTRAAGARSAARAAENAAIRSSRAARSAAGRTLQRRTATAAERRGARRVIDNAKRDARQAPRRAARQVRDAPLADPTGREILRAGNDPEAARFYKDVNAIRSRFPGDADVAHASRHADLLRNTSLGTWVAGSTTDTVDKVGEKMGVKPYSEAKDHFTHEVGSTW